MFRWDYEDPLALATGEPSRANQALHDYALLGPERSLAKLCERYQSVPKPYPKSGPPTKRLPTLKAWSAAYSWVERVAAYDEQQRVAERAALAALRKRRAAELGDRNWELADRLAKQVETMLQFPLAQVEQVTKRRQLDDGRTTEIHMTIVKPAKWSFQTAAIMAEVAAKLGALAVGEPTERTAHVIDGLTPKDLENMSVDELLALRAQLQRGGR